MFKLLFLFILSISYVCSDDNIQIKGTITNSMNFSDFDTYQEYVIYLENQNDEKSKMKLARFHYDVLSNYEKAYYLFLELDKNNNGLASTYLGIMYSFGRFVSKDETIAYKYFIKGVKDKNNSLRFLALQNQLYLEKKGIE